MTDKCAYCGMLHGMVCHMIKSIEYHSDGTVKKVEFKTSQDYAQVNIPSVWTSPQYVWPHNWPQAPTYTCR